MVSYYRSQQRTVPVEISMFFPKMGETVPPVMIGTAECKIEFSPTLDPLYSNRNEEISTRLTEAVYPKQYSVFDAAIERKKYTEGLLGLEWGQAVFRLIFSCWFGDDDELCWIGLPLSTRQEVVCQADKEVLRVFTWAIRVEKKTQSERVKYHTHKGSGFLLQPGLEELSPLIPCPQAF